MKYLAAALMIMAMCLPAMAAQAAGEDYPWCAQQDIFFRNDSSDIAGYAIADHIPELASTKVRSVSVSSANSPQRLAVFATKAGSPGVDTIAPGLWRFRTYLNVSSATGVTTFEFIPYIRSSSGVETQLFYGQVLSNEVNSLTATENLISYARRNYTQLSPGDRLVIKVNASTTSVTARTAYISLAGNTQASMVAVSYFLCPEVSEEDIDNANSQVQSLSGGEATAIVFGLAGGMIGAIMIARRSKK